MKSLLVAAALMLSPSAARAADRFPDMPSGRYDVTLDGMLCHTCLKLIVQETSSLKEVEKASGDFDQDLLTLTIRPKATLKAKKLQKALRRAAKKADLGTQFTLRAIRYRVK